ncbi:MAG: hypothetical protein RJB13_1389, partial [Pseudomonadota bacterium]
ANSPIGSTTYAECPRLNVFSWGMSFLSKLGSLRPFRSIARICALRRIVGSFLGQLEDDNDRRRTNEIVLDIEGARQGIA